MGMLLISLWRNERPHENMNIWVVVSGERIEEEKKKKLDQNIPQTQSCTSARAYLLCVNLALQRSIHVSEIIQLILIPPCAQPQFEFLAHFPCLLGI